MHEMTLVEVYIEPILTILKFLPKFLQNDLSMTMLNKYKFCLYFLFMPGEIIRST